LSLLGLEGQRVAFDGKQTRRLLALEFDPNSLVLWDFEVGPSYTKFMIDPHFGNFILFSGDGPLLSIFKFASARAKPAAATAQIEVPELADLCDAQWCVHLPGFLVLLTLDDVWYFHIEAEIVTRIAPHRTASSTYQFLVQVPDDATRFIVFRRNGGILVFRGDQSCEFVAVLDLQFGPALVSAPRFTRSRELHPRLPPRARRRAAGPG
jgi:hypothetical protein